MAHEIKLNYQNTTMRKTKAEALKTREDLLLSALHTFYQQGVARTSLNEIARNAGVTRGALYWHFKNKEDLFDALFQMIFKDIDEKFEHDFHHTLHPKANLRQALINMFERLQDDEHHRKFCNILHLKCEHVQQNQSIIHISQKYYDMWEEQLRRSLRLCIQYGELPADLDLEMATLSMRICIKGLMHTWLYHGFDLSQIAPRFIDIALDTLNTHTALRQMQTP